MGKFKAVSYLIVSAIIFIIVMGGMIYHDVFISNVTLTEITERKKGEIQLIAWVFSTSVLLGGTLIAYFLSVLKTSFDNNNILLVTIKGLNEKVIALLNNNAETYSEIMKQLSDNTKADLDRDKRLNDHDYRIKKIEKHIGL